jgi:CubicO group peptidase (beta-lactamase class C family)
MLDRRAFLVSTSVAIGSAVAVTGDASAATDSTRGRFDRPRSGWASADTTLRAGEPHRVGLDPAPIDSAHAAIHAFAEPPQGRAMFPGAVMLLAHQGFVVDDWSTGWSLRYADHDGTELPEDQRITMRTDTIFDMASCSKLFTTLVALRLMEQCRFHLDEPVAEHVPGYGVNGKEKITPRMLLTHTAGLRPDPEPSLWQGYSTVAQRKHAILTTTPQFEPGSRYQYSDLSMLSLQLLVESVTESTLDKLLGSIVTGPLGMIDTGYNPSHAKKHRIAPTEFETGEGSANRGLVWGEVHDENAWSLDGVAGHAGVFSTARDMARLGQMLLNGGTYAGHRILHEGTTELVFENFNERFPGDDHGLGFELDQIWYMGGLSGPQTAGHTGFTGTTFVVDRTSRSIAVLLTNRVHPNRDGVSINPARELTATALSRAMAVLPVRGHDYWSAQTGNAATATLSSRVVATGNRAGTLRFDAFVNSEPSDLFTVECATDGKTWKPLALRASGVGAPQGQVSGLSGQSVRAWWRVEADLPAAPTLSLRWRYTTDKSYTGRGVCVDGVRVTTDNTVLLDAERDRSALVGNGWQRRSR